MCSGTCSAAPPSASTSGVASEATTGVPQASASSAAGLESLVAQQLHQGAGALQQADDRSVRDQLGEHDAVGDAELARAGAERPAAVRAEVSPTGSTLRDDQMQFLVQLGHSKGLEHCALTVVGCVLCHQQIRARDAEHATGVVLGADPVGRRAEAGVDAVRNDADAPRVAGSAACDGVRGRAGGRDQARGLAQCSVHAVTEQGHPERCG